MIPLKANVPAWRVAYVTLAVAVGCTVAFVVLHDRPALAWPAVFVAGNLVALWTFGSGVEALLGPARTLALLALATGLALAGNALLDTPVPVWVVVSALPALTAVIGLAVLRPRARMITLSLVPLFGGVVEIPIAVVVPVWLALEALAVAAW